MTAPSNTSPPRALPRRANGIRSLAASMARQKLVRQTVSDRISYAVAALIGAAAFKLAGQPGIAVVLVLYLASAYRAYRVWKKAER